ncbi:F0F1 ATP synthase subunit B [Anaerosacchariphilus polymeriproducens]|uniref:ATP synthase subunit b n=1 Tax=Anaerosacchariphilus polymeriproducens TaxID=1812858 RepID=A0A371AZ38_9FIRM|nr:F0F1 ATP synthase subunit B [Anaerosacchariphilus polymeriproducens]RDU24827.1 ATP synthase F0 subunit B [Anaerosacchariphilus polymeriproducens]
MIRLDYSNVIFTIINLLTLYFLMKKFLYSPVMSIIEKRKELINQQIENAELVEKQALQMKGEYEEKLKSLKDESIVILDNAKAKAEKEYKFIIEKANIESDKIIEEAKSMANIEHKKILKEAEADITKLAMLAAAKIIGEQFHEQENQALYDQFIVKAGELNDKNNN